MSKYGTEEIYGYRWDWSAMPYLRMLIPLVIGILANEWIDIRSIWSLAPVVLLMPVYIYFLIKRLSLSNQFLYGLLLQLMVCSIGYSIASFEDSLKDSNHYSHITSEESIHYYGLVQELKERKSRYEAVVCVHQVFRDSIIPVSGKLNIYVPYDTNNMELSIGQHISFKSNVIPHPVVKNPYVFDYGQFLSRKGVHYQTDKITDLSIISECQSPRYQLLRHREAILQRFHEHIDDHTNYAIAASIILGYRDDVDYETKRAFAETGSIHILAVSGMHVGIVFAAAGLLIGRINNRRKWYKYLRTILYLIVIWGFVLLAGMPASAMRAAWLFTFILFAELVQGSHNLFHRLAIAAFVMLVINPSYLQDVGFQLSFTAVLGIAAFLPIWDKIYSSEGAGIIGKLWDGIGLSIGATLGTLPLTIYYFHYFPISGVFSSIVVVFFAAIILQIGVAFLIGYWLSLLIPSLTVLLDWIGQALDFIIGLLVWIVEFFHELPFGLIDNILLTSLGVMCLYMIIISFRMIVNGSRRKVFVFAMVIPLLVFTLSSFVINLDNAQSNQIAFYHDYRNNAIELFNGQSSVIIAEEPIQERQSAFLNKGLHIRKQINHSEFVLSNSTYVDQEKFYSNGALKYGDTEVLIVRDKNDLIGKQQIHWDYVLLINNPDLSISDIQKSINCDTIIIGASNWQNRVEQWIEECQTVGMKYHDIKNSSALIVDVEI